MRGPPLAFVTNEIIARQHDVNTVSTRLFRIRDITGDGHRNERLGSIIGNRDRLNCRGCIMA